MNILNYKTHTFVRNLNLQISDFVNYDSSEKKVYIEFRELIEKLARIYKIPYSKTLNPFKVKREKIRITNGKVMRTVQTLINPESYFEVIYFNKVSPTVKDLYVAFTEIEVIPKKKCHKFKVKHNLLTRLHIEEGEAISITPNVYYKLTLPEDSRVDGEIEIIWIGYC